MLYLTCTTITSVDLAHYRISRAKDWVSVVQLEMLFNAGNNKMKIGKLRGILLVEVTKMGISGLLGRIWNDQFAFLKP